MGNRGLDTVSVMGQQSLVPRKDFLETSAWGDLACSSIKKKLQGPTCEPQQLIDHGSNKHLLAADIKFEVVCLAALFWGNIYGF